MSRILIPTSQILFLLTCLFIIRPATAQPAPTMGPYSVNSSWYKVEALDGPSDFGWPLAWVVYPSNGTGPFPLISYQHGLLGGSVDLLVWGLLFEQIASYGFVVAAADSCDSGCTDVTRGAPWSDCAGLPNIISPLFQDWAPWYAEGLKVIDWAKNMTDAKQDPIFQLIDWSKGVGYAGHSMGGIAAVTAANAACTSRWNIKAVVVHHSASCMIQNTKQNLGAYIAVPTAIFTSSGDGGLVHESEDIKNATNFRPLAYRNEVGWSHLEPVMVPPIENPLLATFTAAWFKLYLSNDASWHSAIYGTGPGSLCGEAPQVECWAKEN